MADPSISFLRGSLALWKRRYAYRHNRAKVTGNYRKWGPLEGDAARNVHYREAQIAAWEKSHTPPATAFITMYDSVTVNEIPEKPQAVAGYVGGSFANFNELVRMFPGANHLSIAISASEDADCLDVEPQDATASEVLAWHARQIRRGVKRPCIYSSLDSDGNFGMPEVRAALSTVDRSDYRLWVANYVTSTPTKVPSGFDGWQFTETALGRNLDQSILLPDFFS
jgi:hypothetical protein